MIKIMIADDQVIVREGLKKILSLDSELYVVCEAVDGYEAVTQMDRHDVDVILMDVRMPKMDGIEASKRIKEKYPHVKIIVLTTFNEDEYLFDGIKNGIDGYLLKDSDVNYVIRSIREVCHDKMVFDPGVTPKLVRAVRDEQETSPASLNCLTERELEIAKMIVNGLSNLEIANALFLSEGTVKNNVSRILRKLNLQRRTQLSALFRQK